MKFRSKMVFAFATVAFLGSVIMGIVVARLGSKHEMNMQKANLQVAANAYILQMDETLGRMDAIMHYILSDANTLKSITLLSEESSKRIPTLPIIEAKARIEESLSTDYILKNSYRTVFFNQNSFLASSFVRIFDSEHMSIQRLISNFDYNKLPYLEQICAGKGESVIVSAHLDYWGVYNNVPVFSLAKALRGENMGFLEVEYRMDSLQQIKSSDPGIQYVVIVNEDELLYATDSSLQKILTDNREKISNLEVGTVFMDNGDLYVKESSDDYDVSVIAYKEAAFLAAEKQNFFLISFLVAFSMFAISLALVVFWAEILTKPVKQLQEIVENTTIDNLQDNSKLEKTEAIDEFLELIQAYQNMTSRLDKAVREEKKATMLQLQSQFDMLQAQINPHFIYNVLNTISSRAILDGDEVICEICGSLGNMLRYSTSSIERYASVKQELDYLESYYYLLKSRYEGRLELTIDVDSEVSKQIIPKMTLQQLIENSVKHGAHNLNRNISIAIVGRMEKDRWTISVKDNGNGISNERLLEIKKKIDEIHQNVLNRTMAIELEIGGMGVVNTYARCLLLYAEDVIFEIENHAEGNGVIVTIGKRA